MSILTFRPAMIEDYGTIYAYMSAFGEGSCQHSFVSMYSLAEKYGDVFCEKDGFLYVMRSHIETDGCRTYLAPMGSGNRKSAYDTILQDAEKHQARVRFHTLTEKAKEELVSLYPGRFAVEELPEMAEYIFPTAEMSAFAGHRLAKRRLEVHTFWNTYGSRATVLPITGNDLADIGQYEANWVKVNGDTHDRDALLREQRAIDLQLQHFDALHLSGVVLRLDGAVRGFGYGTKLNELYYDAIAEKADRDVVQAYKVLRMESVKQCAMDCRYVNMEEDLGIPGLRMRKQMYHPEFLIRKYDAKEITDGKGAV